MNQQAFAWSGIATAMLTGVAWSQPCSFPDRPIQVWKQASNSNVPQQVTVFLSGSAPLNAEATMSGFNDSDPSCANDPAWAPSIHITPQDDPSNDASYGMTWWVFRPDGLDINEITFAGVPTVFRVATENNQPVPKHGREYRLIVGKRNSGGAPSATWDAPQQGPEDVEFAPGTFGARHIGSINGYVPAPGFNPSDIEPRYAPSGNQIAYAGEQEFYTPPPINGQPRPDRLRWVATRDTQGQRQPLTSYNLRVRVGVTGDLGSVKAGDIARVEARRIISRSPAWLGRRHTLSDLLPAANTEKGWPEHPHRLTPYPPNNNLPLWQAFRGDYLNATGSAVSGANWTAFGNVGVVQAGQMGDNGLPLVSVERVWTTASPPGWTGLFENWIASAEVPNLNHDLRQGLIGPERNNLYFDANDFELNQAGLGMPRDQGEYAYGDEWADVVYTPTEAQVTADQDNRSPINGTALSEDARKYEIRRITTINGFENDVVTVHPSRQTSGNIEAKVGIVSAHGSIGRVETRERLAAFVFAKRGTLDYAIGRGGIGGPGRAIESPLGRNVIDAMEIFGGFGGIEMTAGRYTSIAEFGERGADANVFASYVLQTGIDGGGFDEDEGIPPAFFPPTAIRKDGTIAKVAIIRRQSSANGPWVGGNFGTPPDANGVRSASSLTVRGLIPDPISPDQTYDRIYIENDLTGAVSFSSWLDVDFAQGGATLTPDRTIWVGRNWYDGSVNGTAQAFDGIMIVNKQNRGGLWRTVTTVSAPDGSPGLDFRGAVRTPPNYDETIGTSGTPIYIGDGAAGNAPFRLYREDSVPPNRGGNAVPPATNGLGFTGMPFGTVVPFIADSSEYAPNTPTLVEWAPLSRQRALLFSGELDSQQGQEVGRVRLRFYGPLVPGAGSGADDPLVAIEHSPSESFTGGVTDVSDRFRAWIGGPTEPGATSNVQPLHPTQSGGYLRDVIVRVKCGQSLPPGYYRVIRWEDRQARGSDTRRGLRCTDVDPDSGESLPPAVYPFSLYFKLGPTNLSDVAGADQSVGPDGLLTADDIIVFLGWYFASDSRADVAGPDQSTFPDGLFTADDIIVFLGRYFAGDDPTETIPPCSQNLIGGGEGEGEAMRGAAQPESIAGSGDASNADRIAAMQAMIAAETDPQRRAALQAALQILQLAPAPSASPAPATDDR